MIKNVVQVWIIFGSIVFILSGCASTNFGGDAPSRFEIEIRSSKTGEIDKKTSRRSRILHSYLAGQFSYSHDDFGNALKYFEQASALIENPSPKIHAVLAELYLKERRLEDAKREAKRAIEGNPLPSYRLLLAGIHEALNELNEAETQYRELLEEKETVHEAYLLFASLLGRTSRLPEAITVLEKYVKVARDSPVGYELLGRFYELEENIKDAERVYKQAIERAGLNENLFSSLMRVYLKQNKAKEAKKLCMQKLQVNPRHVLATRILGELAISSGSVEEGLELLRGAQKLVPEAQPGSSQQSSEELRFRIALLELERQNYEAAERELLLLAAQNEDHDEARYYLASIYAGSDRKVEALTLLDEIKPEAEMFIKAKTFAAFLLRQEREFDRASDSLEAVLEKEPKNLKARSYLALILRDAEKLEAAKTVLGRGLEYFPEDERLLFQYAVVLQDLNKKEEALQTMERVILVNPKNSDALNFVAYSLAEKSKDLNRAELLARQALDVRPQDGYYLDTLGWVMFQRGDYKEAEGVFARAVSLSDDDVVVLEHYGDVLLKLGKRELAIKAYRQAMESVSEEPTSEELGAKARIEDKLEDLR